MVLNEVWSLSGHNKLQLENMAKLMEHAQAIRTVGEHGASLLYFTRGVLSCSTNASSQYLPSTTTVSITTRFFAYFCTIFGVYLSPPFWPSRQKHSFYGQDFTHVALSCFENVSFYLLIAMLVDVRLSVPIQIHVSSGSEMSGGWYFGWRQTHEDDDWTGKLGKDCQQSSSSSIGR